MKQRTKLVLEKLVDNTAVVVFSLITILSVICAQPWLVGANRASVVFGSSMEPTFSKGDMVLTKHVEPSQISVGEVITFWTEGGKKIVSHRVIEESDDNFKTKGDGNEDPDTWIVIPEALVGKYWVKIPYFGYLVAFIKSRQFILFAVVVGVYLLLTRTWDTYKILTRARKATQVAVEKVQEGYDWLTSFIKAWEWRWKWWRRVLGIEPLRCCVCGIKVNPRYQKYCIECGEEVK